MLLRPKMRRKEEENVLCRPSCLAGGGEQDGRRGGVATAGGVGPVMRSEVSRRRQLLDGLLDLRELTGRREENNGGERGFEESR